ncbi:hypothetical protein AHMF7605_05730 [Adhaeribacter arboris]|uniref:Peptidase S74 domain-containing protein n=1 Tax=Adhaeribacter arboris TaxID=2072846 RepID=A0A2T2YC10_9BACT|nr:tail fiber domain-containing protein [Adhaeribacter arboris]PSR53060.1 hypothetical protein AHMF7605_05730 [Adhaeribacter arboris]
MKNRNIIIAAILFGAATLSAQAQNWSLTGNTGTNPASNFIGTKDDRSLVFRTNNRERMRILGNGFVGIGIISPQALLHIPSRGNVSLSTTDNFLIGSLKSNNLAFDFNKIQARKNGVADTLNLNFKGGAVAIGSGGIFVKDPVNASALYSEKSGYGNAVYVRNLSAIFSSATIMGVTDGPGSGIVGYASLYGSGVSGHAQNGQAGTAGVEGSHGGSGTGVSAFSQSGLGLFGSSSTNYGLYATTTHATYAAYFNKSIFVNGGYYSSSDQKLKQNIQDFTSALGIINQLHPKKYQYRQDGAYKLLKLPTEEQYGLLAQEVEKVLPGLVKNTKFDTALEALPSKVDAKGNIVRQPQIKSEIIEFKALNYTGLIPILVKAVQEQEEKITLQDQQIEKLTAQVNQLLGARSLPGNTGSAQKSADTNLAVLTQNAPNPFTQTTSIHYYVPQKAGSAVIEITDFNGKIVKTYPVAANGNGQLQIEGGQFTPGIYYYSLLVENERVDTKKMVLHK